MKVSTILDHIDNGHMALPEFQRGYVWNREQVRGLFTSLYRKHPVGGLLVWATESTGADYRGDGSLASGVVKLLLDGQQRMTSLYGVVRGKAPKFFEGNERAFTGLQFHLEEETFQFYQPVKMRDDSLWIDVTKLMQAGSSGLGSYIAEISSDPEVAPKVGDYVGRLSQVLSIVDVDLHIEEVTGPDKTLEVVVDIFNRVNSGGTKLSKGDLALAKICAEWPAGRDAMKSMLKEWEKADYSFNLDWLLRSVNTVLTGEAKFQYLHNKAATEVEAALNKAKNHIDYCLNLIAGRLGLDHDRVMFSRFAIPVMVRYLDASKGALSEIERDRLLFWFLQTGMRGRFSGSTESFIDKDLAALEGKDGGLDKLIEQIRLWHGGLAVEPGHFDGWSLGARFYPVLYWLTRAGEAKDWGSGLPLKANMLGKMSKLEVHHIFPKAQLYKEGYDRATVNALPNFCFLTKNTNLEISDRLPEEYFKEIEKNHPGALASQWIPMDHELWKIDNYDCFLEARKKLLAQEANERLKQLLHDQDLGNEEGQAEREQPSAIVSGGFSCDEEEQGLEDLNEWVAQQGFPKGELSYGYSDPESGTQLAVFDLVWPNGLQQELSQPVAVLLNEGEDVLSIASQAGFRCFTTCDDFKHYVTAELLGDSI